MSGSPLVLFLTVRFLLLQRCDGQRPRCGSCARLGHSCTWGDPIHEKLQDKIRQYEAKIGAPPLSLLLHEQGS